MSKLFHNILIVILFCLTALMACKPGGSQQTDNSDTDTEATIEKKQTIRWGIVTDTLDVVHGTVNRGELLSSILLRNGVSMQTIHYVEKASDSTWSVRRIQAGKPYHIISENDSLAKALYFVYEINKTDYVVYSLGDSIYSYLGSIPTDTVMRMVKGSIETSLWNALTGSGASPELAGKLADIYSWTIDFFGIQQRDSFAVYYEEVYADTVRVAIGNILAANFITGSNNHYAFRYKYHNERGEYFDEHGTSLRRAFLKAPLSYSRISSKFSNARRHPITKVVRPHHGVDYAAPSGTPVYSVGDGVVTARGWDSKGGGNYIKIKHNSTYTTEYMHLRGFASGISQGSRVSQGELIGYVGSTGQSTGPHLDYRVFKNGTAIDPLRMDLPAVDPIMSQDMPAYIQAVSKYMEIIGMTLPIDSTVISQSH